MEITFTSYWLVAQRCSSVCFKLRGRKKGAQFARADVWKLVELFLRLFGVLIGMEYQSNKKKKCICSTAFRREVGGTALCDFCLLMLTYSL